MNIGMKGILGTAALIVLSSPAYAVQFALASASGNTWTYTLTFDPLDNYCVQGTPCTATITLAGLSGVTAATGPTSSDAPPGSGPSSLSWIPIVNATKVVWQKTGGGTDNFPTTTHVFGFSVTAPGAITGAGSVITTQFCRGSGTPCTDLNIDTAVAGPMDPAVGSAAGSIAQVAAGGGWGTQFTLVNTGIQAANASLSFFAPPGGNPANAGSPVNLSLGIFPTPVSSVSTTLNNNASVVIDSSGDASPTRQEGMAQLLSTGTISGFGIFRFPASKWEAVVPLETRNASSYVLAFDNTGSLGTGVAVSNVTAQAVSVTVFIREDTGDLIGSSSINLPARGHISFTLNTQYPLTSNKRGTIEFATPSTGQITVVGLRANGPALTTLPVFANVDTNGGFIAHTTYHDQFTSVFYVVNTGVSAAQFTLSFFDELGNTLVVPLFFPKTGETPAPTNSYTRDLAAGAMVVIETQSQSSLRAVVGSAQLLTTGKVSAFEVFRWVPFGQEASVPMENRTPGSFILPFDYTNGLGTGIAISNNGSLLANVTVNIRDTTGAVILSTAISIVPRGHTSFMLRDSFPIVQNRRGTVEFLVPTIPLGLRISVIGLRAKADGTLTTIPVLAK